MESLLPTPSFPGSSSTEILAQGSKSANIGCAAPGRVVKTTEEGLSPHGPRRGNSPLLLIMLNRQHEAEREIFIVFCIKMSIR